MAKAKTSALAKLDVPNVAVALDDLEQQMGGRQALVGFLTLAPLTPDLSYILGLLADPEHKQRKLSTICAAGNILPGALMKQVQSAALLKGQVLAAVKIAEHLPAVAEDVMRRAAPYQEACGECGGTGSLTPEPTQKVPNPSPGPCDTCKGTGQLIYSPDLRRQELALEMGQMLPKAQGINILNQNIAPGANGQGGAGHLEQLQRLSDQILYGDPPAGATEAEIVEE